ncbi:hemagglutinin repeat-containing protein [Enterobacteriaceae bacterium H20N1]|uniref:Hemagglutinin repeat-containing protein n=1 Tax=Dryocola boscaweniae TaxID=2925397 RepID=A0A9X3AN22_9ENTR|nr:hemagglutinin repeat-containing protein [Dryocola boscaweniae]MCT4701376.1 hemagglutinin repeat-containing protein [Dryocola boscaweniae]MCT4718713.1 hemagglutinin repeat-containing protein [Dryocola boscaweniae]
MNRLLYRIIFNKARGMLMVVAEIARSCSAHSPASGIGHTRSRLVGKVSAVSLSLWLAIGAIQTVQAAIVADKSAPGNQQPTIIGTANGTPQVNIQTPSAGGVSRNTFSQFDVDRKGAILNNSRKNTATQLGGMVTGNPWLAKGEAKIVLNEVNARDPSKLNGYIEVAGQKAQVVIASPSGITCNGCGFINAGRATLTTGSAQLQNGNITGYLVDRGDIVVDGKGLDSTRQDHTDIIARAVKVNAAIHANDLQVTTGRNKVDAAHEQTAILADNGSTKPQLALDVSQVGGMYAGKIRLRGTERGVGVRNAGHIGSEAGLVTITADGRIENTGELSSRDALQIGSASGITNSGNMLSQKTLTVTSSGDVRNSGSFWSSADARVAASTTVDNSGSIAARHNVTVSGERITSTTAGTLAAGVHPDGKTGSSGDLTLTASGKLAINGLAVAGGNLQAAGQGLDASGSRMRAKSITLDAKRKDLSTAGAQVTADKTLKTSTAGTHNNSGGQLAADTLQLTAKRLQNHQGQVVQSGTQALTLGHQDAIENREGSIATNARDLTLQTSSLDNRDGEIIHAGKGTLTISSAAFIGDRGSIVSSGQLALKGRDLALDGSTTLAEGISIQADNLSNRDGQLVQSGKGTMALDVRHSTDNRGGQIAANGHVVLNTTHLDNRQGQILAADAGSLSLHATGRTDSREGVLTAAKNVTVTTGQLSNDSGLISAEKGQLALTSTGQLGNAGGQIAAAGDMTVTAGGLNSRQGLVTGNNVTLLLGTSALNNQDGAIAAQNGLTISSGALNNDAGLLQSGSHMVIDTHGQTLTSRNSGETGGIFAQTALTITSGKLDNTHGAVIAGGDTRLTTAGLDNRDGVLASESSLLLTAHSVDNRGGALSAALDMALALAGSLNNRDGVVSSGEHLNISATQLDNTQGTVAAGGDARLSVGQTLNQRGQIAALGNMTIGGQRLDNDSGGLVQSGNNLVLTADHISNRNSGESGGVTSQGNMQITSGSLLNDSGLLLAGQRAALETSRFSNIAGTLVALGQLKLAVRSDTDNREGLIQGNGVTLDTTGHLLDNRKGTIYSLATMQLATAGLNNQNGTLGAKSDFTLKASWLDNSNSGRVVGEQAATFTLASLDNRNGQIQSVGKLLVNAAQGVINNTLGLIRSGASATLNAASLINRDTQVAEKGIEGLNVVISSRALDNTNGTLLTGQNLTITNSGTLDNTRGELAAGGTLLLDGSALNLVNTAGVVKAGEHVTVQAVRIGGDGQLLSLGDMVLSSRQDIFNTGEMTANGNFTLTTPGLVTNNGKLLAGAKLDLTSGNLLNSTTGEIAAGHTWLTVANTLTNYGLIDGNWTLLKAGTLNNTGTGRIYGDFVGIQAGTLSNLAENDAAATIAGRERVDIGAGTINNRDHALIYSAGDMAIGGALDAKGMATGQNGVLNNRSSTIESAGDMSLSVARLNNINDHFSTEVVHISTEQKHEYQHKGSSNRWDADAEGVFIDRNSADNLLNLNTPEDTGHNNDNFYEYSYIRTIEEEVIKESDPGKILSGGHMSISAGHVLNDKSQIVAGGTLGIAADAVENVMPEGSRWIADEGQVTHYSRKISKGSDSQKKSTSDYVPPTVIQSITLRPGRLEGNSVFNGSGMQLASAVQQSTGTTISGTGSITADIDGREIGVGLQTVTGTDFPSRQPVVLQPGQQFEVPVSEGVSGNNSSQTVVRITGPNTQLPDNSLFKTHPEPGAAYLVETDPRFTNNKRWLGSDYMQNAFSMSHDNMHKRLGDGYYEQRLIREQIIALTGSRYLGDHRNDETQFKALMDAGIAFGQKYNLIPGVALTAEQMSLLTEDMVWLVNSQVQLADGRWQTVLVPQVYVRVKPGDIDGSGALLGGQNVVMNLNSDLVNSGTISGREVVQLNAENITNKAGTIQGADVSLLARTDINNIGGVIAGNNSVLASAGRDINVVTTTRSAQSIAGNNRFERTTIERTGGIYVQGENGKLSLSAGRDISLSGAQVVNSGKNSQTLLNAGRDLNLNTVTTSVSDSLIRDQNNYIKQSTIQHVSTSVQGNGNVILKVGQDVNSQAGSVSASGTLSVGAGRDVNLLSVKDSHQTDEKQRYSGKSGGGSRKTMNIHKTSDNETVRGSQFTGNDVAIIAGNNIRLDQGQVSGKQNISLSADHDLNITAGRVDAGGNALLAAGNDINLNAVRTTEQHRSGEGEAHASEISRTVVTAGDNLTLSAGRDVSSQAAVIASENNTAIVAGRDVSLMAESVSEGYSYRSKKKTEIQESVRQQGTEIASGGDTTIIAGRNVTAEASEVVAGGDIGLNAGRDVTLTTATESDYHYKEEKKKSGGFLSKKTTHTISEDSSTREKGSLLSGNSVTVNAGNNLLVKGSDVVADRDVALVAGNDVSVTAATDTDTSWRFKETKKSGLMGTGGIGITVGTSRSTHDRREAGTTQSQSFSTVGSTGGNVVIAAGNQAHIGGADLIAGKDMSLSGSSVIIDPGHDKRTRDETFEQKKSGLTLALSGAVGGAINNAVNSAQDAKNESDGRLAALQATKSVLSGMQAGQAVALDAADSGNTENPSTNAIGVSASLTTQKSKSEQHVRSDEVTGSTLNAGNNLSITATGKNKGPNSGDIMIAGSQLKAGGDTVLDAKNDILLAGAANTQQTTGKNSSSGGGVGVGIGVGSGGWGISVFANGNSAHGKDKGNGTDWTETTIDSGKTVTIKSGNDTVLDGALVNGNKIVADVGHDLLMSSQQDNNDYDSKQTSVAGGGSFTFGSMSGSAYMSVSQDKMKSRFDSVAEQTGLYAGDGGFDITVGNHTQLDGAVIASTATADKNSLDTGTLGFSDIHNEADFKTEHVGGAFNTGGSIAGQFASNAANALLAGGGNKGHAEGTTQAAVADGTVTIRDKDNQKQDVADLSRDTEHANDSISPIFDKEKEQKRLQEIQLIAEIGSQAADIARTQGEILATNAGKAELAKEGIKEPEKGASKEAWADYNKALTQTDGYKAAQQEWGTGSAIQQGMQAATAAIQGLAGGNIAQAISGAAAPYLAEQIHKLTEGNQEAKAMAHAVVGAVTSYAAGNSALAGAAGAVSGELMAQLVMKQLYPGKKVSELTETEKQTISALGTLAAGLAGGVVGDSSADAVAGAQAGKTSVENNYLSSKQIDAWSAEMKSCQAGGGDCGGIIKKYEELSTAQQQQLISDCATSPATCQQKYGDVLADSMNVKQALDRALGEDIPIKMVYDLTATWAHQMDADGIVASNKVSEHIMAKYGLDQAQADIIAGVALSALGGVSKAGKPKYQPNQGAVGNMKEFLTQPGFGTQIKSATQKTSQIYQGQSVYKASNNIGTTIKKGDQFYLDGQHKNHLEVFDSKGNFKAVLNLDGSINRVKTEAAKGRKL